MYAGMEKRINKKEGRVSFVKTQSTCTARMHYICIDVCTYICTRMPNGLRIIDELANVSKSTYYLSMCARFGISMELETA